MNAPDLDPNDEESISRRLNGEFTRPCERFQGKPLWPFTPGSKALYDMTTSSNDTPQYRILSFIFIHLRRTESDMEADLAKHVVPIVWDDLHTYRARVLAMFDGLKDGDMEQAVAIIKKERDLEKISEIDATPPESITNQKKITATSRPESRGKSSARRKSGSARKTTSGRRA